MSRSFQRGTLDSSKAREGRGLIEPAALVADVWPEHTDGDKRSLMPVTRARMNAAVDRTFTAIMSSESLDDFEAALRAHPENLNPERNRRWDKLADMLKDASLAHLQFSTLCGRCGIGWRELINYFMDYQRGAAMFSIAAKTPKLTGELVEDAGRSETKCKACRGKKHVWEEKIDDATGYPVVDEKSGLAVRVKVTCPECDGRGTVVRDGDVEARTTVLEIAGLIQKGKGAVVQVNNYNGVEHEETMRQVGEVISISAGPVSGSTVDPSGSQ